jgi:hypothetical protein
MLLPNVLLIALELAADVSEKLLEVLRIIHNELVNDGLVKVEAGELVGIPLNDDRGHVCEMLRDQCCALHSDENVLRLHLLHELDVGLHVMY